ncbi:M23 family metallopeptidase [Pseudomarimonas salicorniae]|uniref:M23 family metallopeptidase n=1 Tax=Pseudomarimonas salicorniae TaxID=2933270 RepID=A0ABT0GH96_9GAMM|nr:M23 family metallopeptidase [Lysobacter sp. CAU 1642]MCK7593905.1 M23 family metallopeptidase [Lysobacter sp. CAU 1642]
MPSRLALSALIACSCSAALAASPRIEVAQGGVARWSGTDARACMMYGNRYPAVGGDCYFPIDIQAKPASHEVAVIDEAGALRTAWIEVTERDCAEMEIEIEDERFVSPKGEDLERHQRERAGVLKALEVESGEARFSLPLTAPAATMPRGDDDFCATRYFNDREAGSVHTGRDYEITQGSEVRAVAPGRVLIAEDHFMTGNSVYVDHGGGLVSMFFHLGELSVDSGDEVEAGQKVGTIGSTGRSTGPHLHIGLRWIDQRIDPALLLADPDSLPDLAEAGEDAAAKADEDPGRGS